METRPIFPTCPPRWLYPAMSAVGYTTILLVLAAVTWRMTLDADDSATATRRGLVVLACIVVALAAVSYWRQPRPPVRLYHFTSRAAADAAVIETRADGTSAVQLHAAGGWKILLLPAIRPNQPRVYFFDRPAGRSAFLHNLKPDRHEVCFEIVDLAGQRRRIWRRYVARAFAISGDVRATAIRHNRTATDEAVSMWDANPQPR